MKAKLLLCVLALVLLVPLFACAETQTFENAALVLEVDTETTQLSLTAKQSGQTMYSYPDVTKSKMNAKWTGFLSSIVSIDVAKGTTASTERLDLQSAKVDIVPTVVENGVDFRVDFTEKGQRLTVELRLTEDGLTVTVPGDSIEEYGETSLCGVLLLPAFGSTHQKEREGYMFIPEAAGAIIALTDGTGLGNSPYNKRLYGTNIGVERSVIKELNYPAQDATLPIYGMAYTDTDLGYLAIVTKGAESAEIMAYPGGVVTNYNWVGARFIVRESYILQTSRNSGLTNRETNGYYRDMQLQFCLLTGEEANYAGMAHRYRRYLSSHDMLPQADTTYHPRITFLGAESKKQLLWDALVVMTPFDAAREIVEQLSQRGLTAPMVIYSGWQAGGLSNQLGSGETAPEGQLGSKQALMQLSDYVRSLSGSFLLEQDPLLANPERMYNTRFDVVRALGRTVAQINTGKERYPFQYYLAPERSREILLDTYQAYQDSISGMAVASLPHVLFSCYLEGETKTRGWVMDSYADTLEQVSKMPLALDRPFPEYWKWMDAYLELPMDTTSYSYITAEVPFLPMLLSGAAPYYAPRANDEANAEKQLLKMLEYGAYPSWTLTANDVQELANTNNCDLFCARWDVLDDALLARDALAGQVYSRLGGARMMNHQVLSATQRLVTYDNGMQLAINYGDTACIIADTQVEAMSYALLDGGAAQ